MNEHESPKFEATEVSFLQVHRNLCLRRLRLLGFINWRMQPCLDGRPWRAQPFG